LGPRDWSAWAQWTFREFNELPHYFERRMSPSYDAAEGYLQLFGHNEILAAIGRMCVFVGGSLGAILFLFAAMNDAILLHVKIADWNLLWYAGVAGVVYSAGKSMLPRESAQPKSSRNLFAEIDAALANVATHTHHYPDIWKGRGWDPATYKAFSAMFKYKAQLFAMEVVSIILAPYILCVSLANCAESICEFVLAVKSELSGAGEVCGFATFDFDRYSDESWEGKTMGKTDALQETLSESILRFNNVEMATNRYPKPKAHHGKMEKSFFTFKVSRIYNITGTSIDAACTKPFNSLVIHSGNVLPLVRLSLIALNNTSGRLQHYDESGRFTLTLQHCNWRHWPDWRIGDCRKSQVFVSVPTITFLELTLLRMPEQVVWNWMVSPVTMDCMRYTKKPRLSVMPLLQICCQGRPIPWRQE
jgi:hypothetical protein